MSITVAVLVCGAVEVTAEPLLAWATVIVSAHSLHVAADLSQDPFVTASTVPTTITVGVPGNTIYGFWSSRTSAQQYPEFSGVLQAKMQMLPARHFVRPSR